METKRIKAGAIYTFIQTAFQDHAIYRIGATMYLVQLYKQSRIFFFLAILFICGQLFFTWKGVDTFPFYNWGMYSEKFGARDSYTVHLIRADDNILTEKELGFNTWDNLQTSLSYYSFLQQHDFIDPNLLVLEDRFKGKVPDSFFSYMKTSILNREDANDAFPAWVKKYLEVRSGRYIQVLEVLEQTYQYEDGKWHFISVEKLF